MSDKKVTLSVPAAILVAAIIIAVAIVIAFGGKSNNNTAIPNESGRLTIAEAAKKVRVNVKDVEACVESKETSAIVDAHLADGKNSGAQGTPYNVIIGPTGKTASVSGAQPRAVWDQVLEAFLNDTLPPTPEGDLSANVAPVTDADRIRGNVDAPVTIIEFSDIDCPFCQSLHPTLIQLLEDRPDDVRWVYRHFPLAGLHPEATDKALATECVGELSDDETYWKFLDLLISGE